MAGTVTVIEFADMSTLHTWYDSAEYAEARAIALTAASRTLEFVNGFEE